MARQRGSKTSLRIYEQTVDLTTVAGITNGLALPFIDTDLKLSQDLVDSRVITGDRNSVEPAPGDRGVEGGITIQPDVRSIGYILKHLFGAVATEIDTPSPGLNEHTFTVGDLPVALLVERWMPQIPASFRSFGNRVNSFSLDIGPSGLLEASIGLMGVDEVIPVPATALDATPLTFPVQGFRLPTVTLSEGGAGITIATRFSIELSNNIEGLRTIGNAGRYADLPEGIFTASGSLAVLFENMTLYNKALNSDVSSLAITFASPATPAGQSLQFLFDEVRYALSSPGIQGPGGVIAELNWRAFVQTGTSTAKAILTNDVTSYATIT